MKIAMWKLPIEKPILSDNVSLKMALKRTSGSIEKYHNERLSYGS